MIKSLLNQLNSLSLRYVQTDKDVYFVAKDVELLKGYAGDHFKRSYDNFIKSPQYQPHLFSECPPVVLTLEGQVLKSFKKKYQQKYKQSLGSVNKLHVMNCTAAYHYLYPEVTPQPQSKPKPQLKSQVQSQSLSQQIDEFSLVSQLAALSSYTANPFRREMTVVNTLADQTAKTRRYDLCRYLHESNTLQVFEVKKDPLTPEHVSITLGDKGYLHLLEQQQHSIDFCFVAPQVLPSAARLLALIPNVRFISVDDLVTTLLKEIKQCLPPQGEWYLKRIIEQFNLDVS